MTAEHSHEYDHESAPAEFLIENVGILPQGKVLDVAMGEGRNSIYLAKMGFTVEGVDISPDAVSTARRLAKENGVAIITQVADLEKDYQIKSNEYDVIICFNYLQRSLMSQIKDGIKQGGMIVYETYIIDQAQFGRPRNPDFLLQHNELLNTFRSFRCLRYREGIFENRKAIASLIAEKV